ncbi:hypothetical protein [Undibacterium sp.]|jgi:hypothetical protein|uniref:hypothetical protein n=1 Tax=Undibacterium sp. TaxID=1914977 RepID=UPI002C37B5A0|nr:hypothetical protein [Undibacterium sp.]HTD06881.1 hypothetical protein [Undibacterium sp.]
MLTKKQILLAAGLAGWALLTAIGKNRHHARRHERKLHKLELNTWEGEGGNLPPPAGAVGAVGAADNPLQH